MEHGSEEGYNASLWIGLELKRPLGYCAYLNCSGLRQCFTHLRSQQHGLMTRRWYVSCSSLLW